MNLDWSFTYAAIWRGYKAGLKSVHSIDPVSMGDLVGIDEQKHQLMANTERFVAGKPANHALLWGARGTGKSSLVKAVFNANRSQGLRLIEVDKSELINLPEIVDDIRESDFRFIIYCDDLSFAAEENNYKSLKSVLEGSIELPPENVLLYATSNRRHLMPESMQDNLSSAHVSGEVHFSDTVEEKTSLVDRFGLSLSFYSINQQEYLDIIDHYFSGYDGDRKQLHHDALQFALAKGVRSGRTARQFFNSIS